MTERTPLLAPNSTTSSSAPASATSRPRLLSPEQTVRLTSAGDLTKTEIEAWSAIQVSRSCLDSPFLRPEYSLAVHEACGDVEVAVLEKDGGPSGFLPFQRRGHRAQSVAGRLCEVQGLIVPADDLWSPSAILQQAGLRSWYFDDLVGAAPEWNDHLWTFLEAPYLDLRNGFDAYYDEQRDKGSHQLRQILRKSRKLGREIGPLQFTLHTTDDEPLALLKEWKSAQRLRTRTLDVFQYKWVVDLLSLLQTTQTDHFEGVLSVLRAGSRIAAVHLGIRSGTVLHWWFPAYQRELARYSPGLILLSELARSAQAVGINRIDLGKGPERYKREVCSGALPVAQGAVDLRPIGGPLRRRWHDAKSAIRGSRWRGLLEPPLEFTRRFRSWLAFR